MPSDPLQQAFERAAEEVKDRVWVSGGFALTTEADVVSWVKNIISRHVRPVLEEREREFRKAIKRLEAVAQGALSAYEEPSE